jgi:hypothetical protein
MSRQSLATIISAIIRVVVSSSAIIIPAQLPFRFMESSWTDGQEAYSMERPNRYGKACT